jgi:hypothetical protein
MLLMNDSTRTYVTVRFILVYTGLVLSFSGLYGDMIGTVLVAP